jgi:lia operon protein LiaG
MSKCFRLRTTASALAVVTITSVALSTPLLAQASGTFTIQGDRVEIYNIAGSVRVQSGSGSAVLVEIDAGGADADQLDVQTGRIGNAETLRVIYPDDRIVYPRLRSRSRSQFSIRADGTFFGRGRRGDRVTVTGSGRGLETYADMTISIPAGKTVGVFLGVGEVDVTNVNGDLMVDTGSGGVVGEDIEVDELNIDTGSGRIELDNVTSSHIRLDTGSGSVRLDLTTDVELLDIETGSGRVTVAIPDNMSAELNIETGSGGIDFDMPVTVRRFSRRELHGAIGDGRGRIRVDTGSGGVRFIRR